METGVFLLLQRSSQAVDVPVLEPAKCLFDEADEAMGSPTAGVAPQSQALILADYRAENTVLVESIARNRLQEVFQEILRLIV